MNNNQPLWQPSPEQADASQMSCFIQFINNKYNIQLQNYFELHAWSIAHSGLFWKAIWEFMEILGDFKGPVLARHEQIAKNQWFPLAQLNFAENLLRFKDQRPAIAYYREDGAQCIVSYQELYEQVSALAAWLKQAGLQPGDRVAASLPNCPEAVIAMLATALLGGVWSACSPDFGLSGLLNRFSQIEPKFLFAADSHIYGGKIFDHVDTIQNLQKQLPSIKKIILISNTKSLPENMISWSNCLEVKDKITIFEKFPFNHPLYILYSSGTTGKPKCIVHGAGGTLLQHLKELRLHTDLKSADTIFFYATCAWMMWHWLISSLAVGATLVLYDGSPFYPNKKILFDLIDKFHISVFGVGAKIIEATEKFGIKPMGTHNLKSLRTILTTASPLLPESFDYVYRDIKKNVCLSSISGGTDIISCFALGNPMLPVYRGELQCIGLGMNVQIFNEQGQSVIQEKGELVCTGPFPSMPIYFWNDLEGRLYHQAYFNRFPNTWTHGDYAEITEHGGLIIYGRSDATLNPGGVRIGTAEIYQEVEKFPQILEALAVGQMSSNGEKIILFVKMAANHMFNNQLANQIKSVLKTNLSPHHVPAKIIEAPDFPRTINGKLMEIVVKKIINHQPIDQMDTISNPQCLIFFKELTR
ncbi:MAG: acetoacetate--CoA ligase [Proteobacteria bacterium]|nr:acetoacetate--CoA ligase [Pseudomonadota bacterium]